MVVIGQKMLYWGKVLYSVKSGFIPTKVAVFGQKWFYSHKVVVFGQSVCIRAKVVVFGQSGCIAAKMVVYGQSGFIREKIGCSWAKLLYSGTGGCVRA